MCTTFLYCIACVCMQGLCAGPVCRACGDQKRMLDHLELELPMVSHMSESSRRAASDLNH